MAGLPRQPDVVRFEAYETHLPTQELFKHGLRIKLAPQAFRVLQMLLENPGRLVTREELHRALWPADTFVDFDHGLNNAIKKIRDALCDSAEIPKYIETLPRLGYRFIGQTNETSAVSAATPVTPTDTQTFRSIIGNLEIPTDQSATARPRLSKETKSVQLHVRNSKFLRVTLALVMVAAAFMVGVRWSVVPSRVTQFEVNPPSKTYFNFSGLSGPPVLSPDGSKLAFVAFTQGRSGSLGLWLRTLDSSDARLLPGTEGATFPFWSPDGRFVAFFGGGKLKKVDLAGGSVIVICGVIDARGGTWSTGGIILFGERVGGLYRVEASGGRPVQLTTVDYSRHEFSHRWPQFLPDQRHFVFVAQTPGIPMARLYVASLDSPEKAVLDDVTSSAMFANNHLLYIQNNNLLARAFDDRGLRFTGEPVVLAEHIQNDSQFNYAAFSVSSSTLIYQAGAVVGGTQVICRDRSGKQTVLSEEAEIVQSVALSPKEDQLALSLGLASGQLTDIWTFDLHKNKALRITFDQHSFFPVWSPDGRRLAFDRVGRDGDTLIAKDVLGSGTEEILLKLPSRKVGGSLSATPRVYSLIWTPDGKYLIYLTGEVDLTNPGEIDAVALAGQHKQVTLVRGPLVWSSVGLSPDGRWLAYSSSESGAQEVYVIPFRIDHDGTPTTSGGKWQVSNGGGVQPGWRGDGEEMFFTNSSVDTLMSVRVRATADHFESDKPQILFDLHAHPVTNFYDVTRDGQKIYMTTYGQSSAYPITVTTNWMHLVEK